MVFVIGLLTAVMVLTCLLLILLVLLQLPKKEAGAGLAFGGAASDALFGAGSGTVLTKITKYLAALFFGLAVILSIAYSIYTHRSKSTFGKLLTPQGKPAAAATAPAAPTPGAPGGAPAAPPPGSNLLLTAQSEGTNQPAPVTNPPPAASTNKPAPSTAPK